MPQKKKTKLSQKIITIISGLAFLGFSASMLVKAVLSPPPQATTSENSQQDLLTSKLQQEAKGYELVLEKEPNNRFALEKLVAIKLELGNLEEARPLMEKLVSIQPENERYQEALSFINQGIEAQNNPPNSSSNSSQENSEENNLNSNNIETEKNPQ